MKFLLILLLFTGVAVSGPMIYEDEIILEMSELECFTCFNKAKVSINIMSGGIGDFQTSAIFKLTGEKGKVGSQIFTKLNPYIWFGGEATTDLKFDFDHAFFVSAEINYKKITAFPYMTFSIKEETIVGSGIKVYGYKNFSLGLEYKRTLKGVGQVSFSIGTKVNKEALENLKKLTSFGETKVTK